MCLRGRPLILFSNGLYECIAKAALFRLFVSHIIIKGIGAFEG